MGQAASAAREALDNGGEVEAKMKEQLDLMMKLADARLDTFESELKTMFLDRESSMKTSVPGKRALRFVRSVSVDAESKGGKGVEDGVDSFFGIFDGSKSVLDGIKGVVKGGLESILGDQSAGESYDKRFFVCVRHNAIIRVDMFSYKYNFINKGTIATYKNIMAYILCISVVDHRDVTLDELIYLASEFAGDGATGPGDGFEKYLNMLMTTWNRLQIVDNQARGGVIRPSIEYPTMPLAVAAAPAVTTVA